MAGLERDAHVLAAVFAWSVDGMKRAATTSAPRRGDLRYCTPESTIGVPIARTIGNCLSMSNLARLVDLVCPARAKELIFRARLVPAEEARQARLVNEVVPAERLEERVVRWRTRSRATRRSRSA